MDYLASKRASVKAFLHGHLHGGAFPGQEISGDDEFQEFYFQYKDVIESYFLGGGTLIG